MKLRNAFLNAAYIYPTKNTVESGSAAACKAVLAYIINDNLALAAIEAGKHPAALSCWEAALDVASNPLQPQQND